MGVDTHPTVESLYESGPLRGCPRSRAKTRVRHRSTISSRWARSSCSTIGTGEHPGRPPTWSTRTSNLRVHALRTVRGTLLRRTSPEPGAWPSRYRRAGSPSKQVEVVFRGICDECLAEEPVDRLSGRTSAPRRHLPVPTQTNAHQGRGNAWPDPERHPDPLEPQGRLRGPRARPTGRYLFLRPEGRRRGLPRRRRRLFRLGGGG